jgi:hypothetical protein
MIFPDSNPAPEFTFSLVGIFYCERDGFGIFTTENPLIRMAQGRGRGLG